MGTSAELISRSGDLKRELVDYAEGARFSRALQRAADERFGQWDLPDEAASIDFLDRFILQHRLKDGRTIVERFVTDHPELPDDERDLLLGWRDVVEGIFEVERLDGEALVAVGRVDELTYRIRSNAGPGILAGMKPGSFLIARLAPIADEWLLSGISWALPASQRDDAYRRAADLAARHPGLVFRNPAKLARAWELQREEHRQFVHFFGTDMVILPGPDLAERMAAYARFRMHEARDAEGRTAAESYRETYGVEPPALDFSLPPDLTEAATVAVIYDKVEGMNFYHDFGLVEETFASPELVAKPENREIVLGYLKEPGISPLPFRRLAARDPERASQVFKLVLGRKRFSWERDGETILKRYKPSYFERPMLPAVTPLGDKLTRAQLVAANAAEARPARRRSGSRSPRRNRKSRRR